MPVYGGKISLAGKLEFLTGENNRESRGIYAAVRRKKGGIKKIAKKKGGTVAIYMCIWVAGKPERRYYSGVIELENM